MKEPVRYFHTSLRNPAINYRAGWWAVTVQVAKNKSLLGAIVGVRVVLNELGRAGAVEDIGDRLWQRDYWDDLVTSEGAFKGWQKYIRENPANWSSDRYGACTAYARGDAALLNRPRIAFVASQGYLASALRPRRIWAAEAARFDKGVTAGGGAGAATGGTRLSERVASAAPVLISTFTSAQEREALRRALAKGKPLVAVFPAGLPGDEEMPYGLATAIREGWALAISPQPPGARLNKKIATWCNEFVIRHAHEIWVGDLSPNGMLTQMLKGLGKLKTM